MIRTAFIFLPRKSVRTIPKPPRLKPTTPQGRNGTGRRIWHCYRGLKTKILEIKKEIREKDMPPKPTLDMDMAEFRRMKNLMIKAQEGAREIRRLQDDVLPKLKAQLADTKGLFKGKERKALSEQIQQTEKEIAAKLDMLPDILKEDGYPDVQAFMRTFREMESVVDLWTDSYCSSDQTTFRRNRNQYAGSLCSAWNDDPQYSRDLAEWGRQTSRETVSRRQSSADHPKSRAY